MVARKTGGLESQMIANTMNQTDTRWLQYHKWRKRYELTSR